MARSLTSFPVNNTELDPETTDFRVKKVGKGCVIDVYIQSRLTRPDLLAFLAKGGKLGKKLIISEDNKGQWRLANRLTGETVALLNEVQGNGGLVINVNFSSEDFDGGVNAENEIRKRFLTPANQTVHFIENEVAPLTDGVEQQDFVREPAKTLIATEFIKEVRGAALETVSYQLDDPPQIPNTSLQAIERNKAQINGLGLRIRHLGTHERPQIKVGGQDIKVKTIVKIFSQGNHHDQLVIAFSQTGKSGGQKQWAGYQIYKNPEFEKLGELLPLITTSS